MFPVQWDAVENREQAGLSSGVVLGKARTAAGPPSQMPLLSSVWDAPSRCYNGDLPAPTGGGTVGCFQPDRRRGTVSRHRLQSALALPGDPDSSVTWGWPDGAAVGPGWDWGSGLVGDVGGGR